MANPLTCINVVTGALGEVLRSGPKAVDAYLRLRPPKRQVNKERAETAAQICRATLEGSRALRDLVETCEVVVLVFRRLRASSSNEGASANETSTVNETT